MAYDSATGSVVLFGGTVGGFPVYGDTWEYRPCTADTDCDDANSCTRDLCSGPGTPEAACTHENITGPCEDGDACTTSDTCDGAGQCTAGPPLSCDDGNACTTDSCDAVNGCVHTPLPDQDGDGVCDATDACPATILTSTVVIDSCDSGVGNHILPVGCNFGDEISECGASARNHGQFVSCVAHLVNTWKDAGLITGQQGGRIARCAAQ
jgi:hypothetical protein